MPSSSSPEPSSYETPLAVSISASSMVATRSRLDEVAGRGRAVDRDERAEAAAQAVELLVDLVVVDLDGVDRELEAVVVGQLDLGAHVDLDREQQVAREVLLVRPLDDVGLGAAEGAQLVLGDRLAVEPVEALVDGVLEHGGLADALVDDGRRHLALAEARAR